MKKKPVVLKEVPDEIDEFGASGGMPNALPGPDRSHDKRAVTEITWNEFDRQVQTLALKAKKAFKPEAVVGLVHGGVFVGGAIASALKLEFYPLRVSTRSRDRSARSAGDEMPAELKGKRVLIVDDIAASGDSLEFALKLAKARGIKEVATAALIARPSRYEPDFSGFTTEGFFVFPWDYAPLVDDSRFGPAAKAEKKKKKKPATKR